LALSGAITIYIAVQNKQTDDVTPQPSAAATCCGCYYVDSSKLQQWNYQCPEDSNESDNSPLDYRGDGRDCSAACAYFPFKGDNERVNPETGDYDPQDGLVHYDFGILENGNCTADCSAEYTNNIGDHDFPYARCAVPEQECDPACTSFTVVNADGSEWEQPIILGTPLRVEAVIEPSIYFRKTADGNRKYEYDREEVIEVTQIKFVFNEGESNQVVHTYNEGTPEWNQNIDITGSGANTIYEAFTTISNYTGDNISVRAYASDGVDTITSATCTAEFEVIPPATPLCTDLTVSPSQL
jgi:hypothetical protein